jgi:hypothetical protein
LIFSPLFSLDLSCSRNLLLRIAAARFSVLLLLLIYTTDFCCLHPGLGFHLGSVLSQRASLFFILQHLSGFRFTAWSWISLHDSFFPASFVFALGPARVIGSPAQLGTSTAAARVFSIGPPSRCLLIWVLTGTGALLNFFCRSRVFLQVCRDVVSSISRQSSGRALVCSGRMTGA